MLILKTLISATQNFNVLFSTSPIAKARSEEIKNDTIKNNKKETKEFTLTKKQSRRVIPKNGYIISF